MDIKKINLIIRKIIFLINFLIIVLPSLSQNNFIDSLQQKLSQSKEIDKIPLLNELSIAYFNVDIKQSLFYIQEAQKLSDQFNFYNEYARTLNILGIVYYFMGDYLKANSYYNECIEFARKHNKKDDLYKCLDNKISLFIYGYIKVTENDNNIFRTYINMAIERKKVYDFNKTILYYIYFYHDPQTNDTLLTNYFGYLKKDKRIIDNRQFLSSLLSCEGFLNKTNQKYDKAIHNYEEALNFTDNDSLKLIYLFNISIIFLESGKYKESIKYCNEVLDLMKDKGNEYYEQNKYTIIATLGATYLEMDDYKNALLNLKAALNSSKIFIPQDYGTIYNNLGNAYLSVDSLKQADYYLSKAITLFDSLNLYEMKLGALNSKADMFIKNKQDINLKAIIYEISSLVFNVSDSYIKKESYDLLSNYYEKCDEYENSLKFYKLLSAIKDSISSKEVSNTLNEFNIKYETEKKEQQIKEQQINIKNKNRLVIFSLINGIILLAVLLVVAILYRKKNQAYKRLVLQNLDNIEFERGVISNDGLDEIGNNNSVLKYSNSFIDDEQRNQILECLNKLLKDKVYTEIGLTIKKLAEMCQTNRTYISQIINEKYGMNFNTFINKFRIDEAKRILSEAPNDFQLKNLYCELGFNSYSTFNEAFRKQVGVSPSFFQKTISDYKFDK
jgi:AraC-like DNA-binding protein/DNA-binding XRE family transcriptional regulator